MRLENVKTWPAFKASRLRRFFVWNYFLAFGMNRLTISSIGNLIAGVSRLHPNP